MEPWHITKELFGRFLRGEASRGEVQQIVEHLFIECPRCSALAYRVASEAGLFPAPDRRSERAYDPALERALTFASQEEQRLAVERLLGWAHWASLEPEAPDERFTISPGSSTTAAGRRKRSSSWTEPAPSTSSSPTAGRNSASIGSKAGSRPTSVTSPKPESIFGQLWEEFRSRNLNHELVLVSID